MWTGRLNIIKMSALHNIIYRFKAMPTKILASYVVDFNKMVPKFICRGKRSKTSSTTLRINVGRMMPLNFKTYIKLQ